jgi:hypothetical protein
MLSEMMSKFLDFAIECRKENLKTTRRYLSNEPQMKVHDFWLWNGKVGGTVAVAPTEFCSLELVEELGSRYIAHRVPSGIRLGVMSPVTLYCPFRPLAPVSPPLVEIECCRDDPEFLRTTHRREHIPKFPTCWCFHGFSQLYRLAILPPTLCPAICH